MSRLNPNAVAFWLLGAAIGFLIGGWNGLALGVALTVGFSLLLSLLK